MRAFVLLFLSLLFCFVKGGEDLPTETEILDILDVHNTKRCDKNIPRLEWSNELALSAEEHITNNKNALCGGSLSHSGNTQRRDSFVKYGGVLGSAFDERAVGENIAWGGGSAFSAKDLTTFWWDSSNRFDPNRCSGATFSPSRCEERGYLETCETNSCVGCGHYTQCMWDKTRLIGCGYSRCGGSGRVLNCQYWPAGNFNGGRPFPQSSCALTGGTCNGAPATLPPTTPPTPPMPTAAPAPTQAPPPTATPPPTNLPGIIGQRCPAGCDKDPSMQCGSCLGGFFCQAGLSCYLVQSTGLTCCVGESPLTPPPTNPPPTTAPPTLPPPTPQPVPSANQPTPMNAPTSSNPSPTTVPPTQADAPSVSPTTPPDSAAAATPSACPRGKDGCQCFLRVATGELMCSTGLSCNLVTKLCEPAANVPIVGPGDWSPAQSTVQSSVLDCPAACAVAPGESITIRVTTRNAQGEAVHVEPEPEFLFILSTNDGFDPTLLRKRAASQSSSAARRDPALYRVSSAEHFYLLDGGGEPSPLSMNQLKRQLSDDGEVATGGVGGTNQIYDKGVFVRSVVIPEEGEFSLQIEDAASGEVVAGRTFSIEVKVCATGSHLCGCGLSSSGAALCAASLVCSEISRRCLEPAELEAELELAPDVIEDPLSPESASGLPLPMLIGIVGAVGFLLLVLVIVLVVCLAVRRRRRSEQRSALFFSQQAMMSGPTHTGAVPMISHAAYHPNQHGQYHHQQPAGPHPQHPPQHAQQHQGGFATSSTSDTVFARNKRTSRTSVHGSMRDGGASYRDEFGMGPSSGVAKTMRGARKGSRESVNSRGSRSLGRRSQREGDSVSGQRRSFSIASPADNRNRLSLSLSVPPGGAGAAFSTIPSQAPIPAPLAPVPGSTPSTLRSNHPRSVAPSAVYSPAPARGPPPAAPLMTTIRGPPPAAPVSGVKALPLPPTPQRRLPQAPVAPKVKRGTALYSFTAEKPGDLTVEKGDELIIINDDTSWYQCKRSKNGQIGILPSNYIKRADPPTINK